MCALTHRAASLLNLLLSFSGGAWCFLLNSLWHCSTSSANCFEAERRRGRRQEGLGSQREKSEKGDGMMQHDDSYMTAAYKLEKCELESHHPKTDSDSELNSMTDDGVENVIHITPPLCLVPITHWPFHKLHSLSSSHTIGPLK